MIDISLLLFAYILGLFPSAYVFSKAFKHVDVRHAGTGNAGAMNTIVNIGILPGVLTLLFDAGKGFLVVYLTMTLSNAESVSVLALFLLILAHNYNPLMGFTGGKGFANLGGGLILLSPLTILAMIGLTTVLLIIFKVPRATAGIALPFFPLVIYLQTHNLTLLLGMVPITIVIFFKHIPTLKEYVTEWRSDEHLF